MELWNRTLNCNGKLVCFDRPVVMGIVNVTSDSFYDGGGYPTEADLIRRCQTIITEGGDIIDVGAVSSRPGAPNVDATEELRRLDRALVSIRKHFPETIISVDTCHADTAKAVVEKYGVNIINDITAGALDDRMFETVAALHVPYVLTHIQGTPATMQKNPVYNNLMSDIIGYFSERVHRLRRLGVQDIIIDPGFGFGKTMEHNYEILSRLKDLKIFRLPVLVGVSRKSMIYELLETDAQHALNGTTAANTLALAGGADILRVHDVKEAVECVKIAQNVQSNYYSLSYFNDSSNFSRVSRNARTLLLWRSKFLITSPATSFAFSGAFCSSSFRSS